MSANAYAESQPVEQPTIGLNGRITGLFITSIWPQIGTPSEPQAVIDNGEQLTDNRLS
jgi:hypothetical protein